MAQKVSLLINNKITWDNNERLKLVQAGQNTYLA